MTETMVRYLAAAPGIDLSSVDEAETLAALEKLEKSTRGLTPHTLLAAAQRESHPLHEVFEWDDMVAAHRFRLDQARKIVQSVKVRYQVEVKGKVQLTPIRYYESQASEIGEEHRRYVPVFSGDGREDRKMVRRQAAAALERWRKRFAAVVVEVTARYREE